MGGNSTIEEYNEHPYPQLYTTGFQCEISSWLTTKMNMFGIPVNQFNNLLD